MNRIITILLLLISSGVWANCSEYPIDNSEIDIKYTKESNTNQYSVDVRVLKPKDPAIITYISFEKFGEPNISIPVFTSSLPFVGSAHSLGEKAWDKAKNVYYPDPEEAGKNYEKEYKYYTYANFRAAQEYLSNGYCIAVEYYDPALKKMGHKAKMLVLNKSLKDAP